MRNKYPGFCFRCGKEVPAGAGFFQRNTGADAPRPDIKRIWLIRCVGCVGKGNEPAFRVT